MALDAECRIHAIDPSVLFQTAHLDPMQSGSSLMPQPHASDACLRLGQSDSILAASASLSQPSLATRFPASTGVKVFPFNLLSRLSSLATRFPASHLGAPSSESPSLIPLAGLNHPLGALFARRRGPRDDLCSLCFRPLISRQGRRLRGLDDVVEAWMMSLELEGCRGLEADDVLVGYEAMRLRGHEATRP